MAYPNPILCYLPLNGTLQMRDRLSPNLSTATGSGALRWAPAEGARINAFPNPSFEGSDFYTVIDPPNTQSRSTDFARTGSYSLKITANVSGATSAWVPSSSLLYCNTRGDLRATNATVSYYVYLAGVSSRNFQGRLAGQSGTSVSVTPGVWTRVTHTFTPAIPSGSFIVPHIGRCIDAQAGDVWYVDDVLIEFTDSVGDYFSGATQSCSWIDPITGQLGTPHASPSVSEAAAWVEEATTNLVPNPWRAVNNAGWSALNGTTGRTTSYSYQGPAAGLVTATAANAEEYISITAAAANHTAQAIVRSMAAASRQCQLTYNGSLIGSPVSVAARASATITAPFTGTGSAANLGVRWIDSANTETFVTYYLGGEAKFVATSPCPAIDASGNLLTGYSWVGTAHASASTRALAGIGVGVMNDDRINTVQGASFARFVQQYISTHHQVVWHHGGFFGLGNDSVGIENHTSGVLRSLVLRGAGPLTTASLARPAAGDWTTVYSQWSASSLGIALGAGAITTAATNAPNGVPDGALIHVANHANGTTPLNGFIGPVAIFSRELTDVERAAYNTRIDAFGDLWSLYEQTIGGIVRVAASEPYSLIRTGGPGPSLIA